MADSTEGDRRGVLLVHQINTVAKTHHTKVRDSQNFPAIFSRLKKSVYAEFPATEKPGQKTFLTRVKRAQAINSDWLV